MIVDWRDDAAHLPRTWGSPGVFFEHRQAQSRGWVIHHFGASGTAISVEQVNMYHQQKDWGDGARAPHAAYHAHAPRDYRAWAAARGISVPETKSGIVVLCNFSWERGWHATWANDEFWGLSLQLDGMVDAPDAGQLAAIQFVLDGRLASYGFPVPEGQQVYGHRELGPIEPAWWNEALFGTWRDYGNQTICPGDRVQNLIEAYRAGVPFWRHEENTMDRDKAFEAMTSLRQWYTTQAPAAGEIKHLLTDHRSDAARRVADASGHALRALRIIEDALGEPRTA